MGLERMPETKRNIHSFAGNYAGVCDRSHTGKRRAFRVNSPGSIPAPSADPNTETDIRW